MSAYKQFTTKDIVITPFSANKGFSFTGAAMTASNVGIEIYFGTQPPANKLIFETTTNPFWQSTSISGSQNATGFVNKLNTNSVYSSVMQLYYSNYFQSMSGSAVATSSLLYGLEGSQNNTFASYNNIDVGLSGSNNIPIGAVKSPQYDNYLSSTITQTRAALIGEEITWNGIAPGTNYITAISIPSKLYGNNIEPQSFYFDFKSTGQTIYVVDDGNGNLIQFNPSSPSSTNQYCGNIIYEHGIAILTGVTASYNGDGTPGNSNSSIARIGSLILNNLDGYNSGTDYFNTAVVGFSSSVQLYENQYKCVIRENEFGYSLNPSLLSGSQSEAPLLGTNYVYKDFATGSYFSPYITTVGLYDNDQNLLAIGKLSVPTKVPMNADLEIQVAFDTN
tara:strand:- start:140 stop:1315 length:1176 start_codon:yes stop_codon:yes gene_type:complete